MVLWSLPSRVGGLLAAYLIYVQPSVEIFSNESTSTGKAIATEYVRGEDDTPRQSSKLSSVLGNVISRHSGVELKIQDYLRVLSKNECEAGVKIKCRRQDIPIIGFLHPTRWSYVLEI